jgi:S1-C subfamily serine protease
MCATIRSQFIFAAESSRSMTGRSFSAARISVTLSDGKTYPATVVGTDVADDLAVNSHIADILQPLRRGRSKPNHRQEKNTDTEFMQKFSR